MDEQSFKKVVEEEWVKVPSPYRERIRNVAVLVEEEPSDEVRKSEGLAEGEMLLGFYHGVPLIERGEGYGTAGTLPDTITIYRVPMLLEAEESGKEVREVVRDTIWHEVGHYFGYGDEQIHLREDEGTNEFGAK